MAASVCHASEVAARATRKVQGNAPRIGIVLSSGGGRGIYAHTGFLLALQQLGIAVSAIAGCSAGAIVGGIAASGADLQRWSAAIANIRERDYWMPDPWLRLLWQVAINKGRGCSGLSDTNAAIDFCRRNLAVHTFAECRVPFYSLALDLDRGTKVLFSEGELAPRMMASAAMPLLYRPVQIEGKWYADGAVIDLAPAEAICCKHHLDALIVHHVSLRCEQQENVQTIINQPWALARILQLSIYHQRPWYLSDQPLAFRTCRCGCDALIVVLEPELPPPSWPLHTGGTHTQDVALSQTLARLLPYVETLTCEPHKLLPGN